MLMFKLVFGVSFSKSDSVQLQQEIQEGSRSGDQEIEDEEEEDLALASKSKGMSKKGSISEDISKGKKKQDTRKLKCFACHQIGHYAKKCPNEKKGKQKKHVVVTTNMDEFAAKFTG